MDDDILFEELIELSHAQRVEKMGWCICEGTNGEGQLADDCPNNPNYVAYCLDCDTQLGENTVKTHDCPREEK